MKTLALSLCALLAAPAPLLAASLESAAYESRKMVEPVIPAEDLERVLVADNDTVRVEVEHRPYFDPGRLDKKQKQQVLAFMAGGAILGAITAGTFGALLGLACGAMVWLMLAWAEVL